MLQKHKSRQVPETRKEFCSILHQNPAFGCKKCLAAQCFSVVRTTVYILGQEALSYSSFESFLASGAEIECMVHVAMPKLHKKLV